MKPWGDLCSKYGINTVLSPFISRERLDNKHVHVKGSKIVRETGFEYERCGLGREEILECLEEACEAGLFMRIWEGEGGKKDG